MHANKEEDDKMRTTAANVAARAAVGGDDMLSKWQLMAEQARQKREGLDGPSSSQPGKVTSNRPSLRRNFREQQETQRRGGSSSPSIAGKVHTASLFFSPSLSLLRLEVCNLWLLHFRGR